MEIQTEYLPQLLRNVTESMTSYCAQINDEDLARCFRLCASLLSHSEPSMTSASDPQSPHRQVRASIVSRSLTEAQRRAMDDVLDGKPLDDVTSTRDDNASVSSLSGEGSPERLRRSDVTSTTDDVTTENVNSTTVMQACLDSYKHLFCVFVTSRVLNGRRDQAFNLVRSLVGSDVNAALDQRSAFGDVSTVVGDVFSDACRLLIDSASFPLFCSDSQLVLKESMKEGNLTPNSSKSCLLLRQSCPNFSQTEPCLFPSGSNFFSPAAASSTTSAFTAAHASQSLTSFRSRRALILTTPRIRSDRGRWLL